MSLEIVKLSSSHSSITVQHQGAVTPHTVLVPSIRTVRDALEIVKTYCPTSADGIVEFKEAVAILEAFILTR